MDVVVDETAMVCGSILVGTLMLHLLRILHGVLVSLSITPGGHATISGAYAERWTGTSGYEDTATLQPYPT